MEHSYHIDSGFAGALERVVGLQEVVWVNDLCFCATGNMGDTFVRAHG